MTITLSCCSAIKDNQHQTERERDKEAIDLIIGTKEEKISTNNFHDNEIIILQAMKFRLTEM